MRCTDPCISWLRRNANPQAVSGRYSGDPSSNGMAACKSWSRAREVSVNYATSLRDPAAPRPTAEYRASSPPDRSRCHQPLLPLTSHSSSLQVAAEVVDFA